MTIYALSKSYNALLVESNSYFARLSETLLKRCGIKSVVLAHDSAETMTYLHEATFDVVLCDFDAPPNGGLELLKMIRNRTLNPHYRIPVIMTCSDANIKAVINARDLGATEFLARPISPKNLHRALRSALEQGRPFIESEKYVGPDRRRKEKDIPAERRGQSTDDAVEDEPAMMEKKSG